MLVCRLCGGKPTRTLYTDAGCTQQAHQQVVPIETVAFVSRLKTFTPENAPKGPTIDEVHETLTGVNAAGDLYLTVTGTGITPVGGACEVQATVQPPAAVVKDANGLLVGTPVQASYGPIALRSVGGTTVGIDISVGYTCVLFSTAGCGGQGAVFGPGAAPGLFAPALIHAATLYYVTSAVLINVSGASEDCGGGCVDFPGGPFNTQGYPTATATIPALTPKCRSRARPSGLVFAAVVTSGIGVPTARASDLPVTYAVQDKTLKASAVAGTPLTFTLAAAPG
jgi:hypothetical protein